MFDAKSGLDDFFFSSVGGKGVYDALPDGVKITFDLHGEHGGTWTVSRDQYGEVSVVRHKVSRPDCQLRSSVEDFEKLVRGTLDVREAFLDGRVAVKGDVGLVWRLQKLLVARQGA